MKNFIKKHKIIKNFIKKHKKVLIIILIIVLIPVIYTLARFIIERTTSGFIESKNFYFNSNRLKNDNPLYQIIIGQV